VSSHTSTTATADLLIPERYVLLLYFTWINPVVYQVPRSYVVPVNFGLFILGNIWQAALALDALRTKNILQLYSISALNICLFVFSVMRYWQTMETAQELQVGFAPGPIFFTNRGMDYWARVRPALLTSSVVVGVCTVVACVWVYFLQLELRWAIYRHISGSVKMLKRYLAYQVRLSGPLILSRYLIANRLYRFCWFWYAWSRIF
jgi:hypothetical protein